MRPGRSCPVSYRYPPGALAAPGAVRAQTLYVIGGLYGNAPALDAVFDLAAREPAAPRLIFNGDFNWFNIDAPGFESINRRVLAHIALRGNVETELAGDDAGAGCGCGYPEWVGEAEVERSNLILARLRDTARAFPELRARLAALPMYLSAEVGGLRVAIVHGDTESLAGWRFAQEHLRDEAARAALAPCFEDAAARIIASSHTCLPVAVDAVTAGGRCVLINNGAAGMPNFAESRCGMLTRIATMPCAHVTPLHATALDGVHIEALPIRYDTARWEAEFLANWPAGSPAHASYYRRITHGPSYTPTQAARWSASRVEHPEETCSGEQAA